MKAKGGTRQCGLYSSELFLCYYKAQQLDVYRGCGLIIIAGQLFNLGLVEIQFTDTNIIIYFYMTNVTMCVHVHCACFFFHLIWHLS